MISHYKNLYKPISMMPKASMYDIFTHIGLICMVNVGKYTIHGCYMGNGMSASQPCVPRCMDPTLPKRLERRNPSRPLSHRGVPRTMRPTTRRVHRIYACAWNMCLIDLDGWMLVFRWVSSGWKLLVEESYMVSSKSVSPPVKDRATWDFMAEVHGKKLHGSI